MAPNLHKPQLFGDVLIGGLQLGRRRQVRQGGIEAGAGLVGQRPAKQSLDVAGV
jgi:hypothetical protein